MWDTPAQEIMAKNYLRPVDAATLAKYQSQFPAIATFEPNQVFGSWDEIMSKFLKMAQFWPIGGKKIAVALAIGERS